MRKMKKNFRDAAKPKALLRSLVGAAVGALLYTLTPTVLNLRGWPGVFVGTVVTWLTGAVAGNREIQVVAIALPVVHLTYVYGGYAYTRIIGKPIWQFQAPGPGAPTDLQDGRILQRGDQRILAQMAQRPTDLPTETPGSTGVSDWVGLPEGETLNDYVTTTWEKPGGMADIIPRGGPGGAERVGRG